jgi:hypothetical protein
VYVPMPLPWERPSTSAVSSSSSARCGRGLEGGKHSEGFVTTLRDLSGRTGRFGGEASAVHSAEPSAAQHFVRATADLVSRTNAIALMTESVSKGPTAALGGEGGGTRRRTTQLPGGGAQSTVTSMKRDVVMRESRRLQSRATTPGGDGGGSSGGTVAQLMDLTAQIRSVVAEHPNVVAVFRQYDDDGDGTLDLLEFRDGLKSETPCTCVGTLPTREPELDRCGGVNSVVGRHGAARDKGVSAVALHPNFSGRRSNSLRRVCA